MKTSIAKTCVMGLLALTVGLGGRAEAAGGIGLHGFGAPVVKTMKINDDAAFMAGVRGGWLIDRRLSIGGGFYGAGPHVKTSGETAARYGADTDIAMWYGGLEAEYTLGGNSLYHLTLSALAGPGRVTIVEGFDSHKRGKDIDDVAHDSFFVFEPGIQGEINVTSWFRVAAGISWLVADGVKITGLGDDDFSGPAGSLTFKFGSF